MLKSIVFNLKFTFGQASCSLCSSHTWLLCGDGSEGKAGGRPPAGGCGIAWGGVGVAVMVAQTRWRQCRRREVDRLEISFDYSSHL